MAVKLCCAGGRGGAGEAVFDSGFSGSLFHGAPASFESGLFVVAALFCKQGFSTL